MKMRLQELRKAAGFRSAKAFADYAGIPVATYTDWEQGHRTPSVERAWFIADLLGVTLDELAGREFQVSRARSPLDEDLAELTAEQRETVETLARTMADKARAGKKASSASSAPHAHGGRQADEARERRAG